MSPVARTMVEVDSKGGIWAVTNDGSVRLDPQTRNYTEYKSPTPAGGTYGIAVDAKDNVWWAQMGSDRLAIADSRTDKVSEFIFKSHDEVEITEEDREAKKHLVATATSGFPDQAGPRRLGADKDGDTVWVAEFYGDRLAKININTKAIKEYALPHPYTRPYTAAVDKNHMVWVALMNTDRLAKFNPFTEKFTEYLLPTRGTEVRHLAVDNRTDPPTVWLPYFRTNKIARIQMRSSHEMVSLNGVK
jgi:virginiamycin B lyase